MIRLETTKEEIRNSKSLGLYVILIILIVVTRCVCVTHEMYNHPDEPVFIHSSVALSNLILDSESEYSELKPYPEGSYFFFAPFQAIFSLLRVDCSPRLINRIGSIFYFTIGCIFGLKIMLRFFNSSSAIIYLALAVFSLFQIEQSRYGTGDVISFALLMPIIFLTASWLKSTHACRIYISFFLVGLLAAVKYPLIYFMFIPLSAVVQKKHKTIFSCIFLIIQGLFFILVGFLLLSPGFIKDIHYIQLVANRELSAYVYNGNLTEIGGTLNHIFSTLFYWLLYSDVLFAPIFFLMGIHHLPNYQFSCEMNEKIFFKFILPTIILGFLLYNLFVTTLFMRTLYPFFAVSLLYTANGLESLLKKRRFIPIILIVVLVLRGVLFVATMLPYSAQDHLNECIEEAIEISGGERIIGLGLETYITGGKENAIKNIEEAENITITDLRSDGFPVLQSGDVVITGSLEFGKAAPYLFKIQNDQVRQLIQGWEDFKSCYKNYYIGQSYPQIYGYIFGFWVKGTNISEYDFPINYVYAIP